MLIVPRQFDREGRAGPAGRRSGAPPSAQSLPPIAWLGDSRQPRCHRSLSCPCRVRRPAASTSSAAAGDDGGGATPQPRARRLRLDARHAARQEGRCAAARAGRRARRGAGPPGRGSSRWRSPGRASSTSGWTRPRPGMLARDVVLAGAGVRPHRPARRAADQPGVRLGQPHRARCTSAGVRWAAVGDALSRLLRAAGAEVGTRVLLQRRRLPDRPVRPFAVRAPRRASPPRRTATAARTSPRSPTAVRARRARRAGARTRPRPWRCSGSRASS